MKKLTFILILAIFSCKSPNKEIDNGTSSELEELKSSIDSLFNSKIGDNEPGAAILVSYNNEILIKKAFGLRDLENDKMISNQTNFRTGSISKQFTALSILDLIDKNKLSLNDSLYKFWPYQIFKDITVRHLLNHTSGLPDYSHHFDNNWNRNSIVTNENILEWLSTYPNKMFRAGTDYEYCNTGYIVLAHLVEKLSGEPFATYVQKNIFEKANMKNTNFFSLSNPTEIKERAYCYEKDSLENWNKVDGNYMDGIMGGGGMYTNIDDYYNYNNAIDKQSILSKEMHSLIFKSSSPLIPPNEGYTFGFLNGKQQYYGMGWFVTDNIAIHGGAWNGARAMVVKDLKRPLTVAVFLNFDSSEIRNELIESTYELVEKYLKTTANKVYKK
jgi:CubicO group peptidase (beta-lactamase class C family)